jgi:clan AA aspartic protease
MIPGVVNSYLEATVSLVVQGMGGRRRSIEAVIDTGFNGSLTLPPDLIEEHRLPWRTRGLAMLADGTEQQFDAHVATVMWDGSPRDILVQVVGAEPLVGMLLLAGYALHVEVVSGGGVDITPLP